MPRRRERRRETSGPSRAYNDASDGRGTGTAGATGRGRLSATGREQVPERAALDAHEQPIDLKCGAQRRDRRAMRLPRAGHAAARKAGFVDAAVVERRDGKAPRAAGDDVETGPKHHT